LPNSCCKAKRSPSSREECCQIKDIDLNIKFMLKGVFAKLKIRSKYKIHVKGSVCENLVSFINKVACYTHNSTLERIDEISMFCLF